MSQPSDSRETRAGESGFVRYIKTWTKKLESIDCPTSLVTDGMRSYRKAGRPITLRDVFEDKYMSGEFVQALGRWPTPLIFAGICTQDVRASQSFPYVIKKPRGHSGQDVRIVRDQAQENKLAWDGDFVLIERLLHQNGSIGELPLDYKCYVFGGRITYVHVIKRLSPGCKDLQHACYDAQLSPIPTPPPATAASDCIQPPTPQQFNEMKRYCRQLGIFPTLFTRVDFYITDDGVVFGEFTPHPNAGKRFTREFCKDADVQLESMLARAKRSSVSFVPG